VKKCHFSWDYWVSGICPARSILKERTENYAQKLRSLEVTPRTSVVRRCCTFKHRMIPASSITPPLHTCLPRRRYFYCGKVFFGVMVEELLGTDITSVLLVLNSSLLQTHGYISIVPNVSVFPWFVLDCIFLGFLFAENIQPLWSFFSVVMNLQFTLSLLLSLSLSIYIYIRKNLEEKMWLISLSLLQFGIFFAFREMFQLISHFQF
jgi:hypothetical protein